MPPTVLEECRARARTEFAKGSPKSWKAAAVIVLVWAAALSLVAYLLLKVFG